MGHSKPVRLKTAPTSPDKSGSKPRGESVYLFLEFTINHSIMNSSEVWLKKIRSGARKIGESL